MGVKGRISAGPFSDELCKVIFGRFRKLGFFPNFGSFFVFWRRNRDLDDLAGDEVGDFPFQRCAKVRAVGRHFFWAKK
jgi:hypothetical protein